MRVGAINAPTLVPLVKMPLPRERSFSGRARATIRKAAGQFADSAAPSSNRKNNKLAKPAESDVSPDAKRPNEHRQAECHAKIAPVENHADGKLGERIAVIEDRE